MKGTFKRISALLLALILLTQTCVTDAFAAEVMDEVTLDEAEMYDAEETESEEADDAVTDQEAESAEKLVEVSGESDATVVEDEEELLKNETDEADETSEQEMEADEDISGQEADAALNEEADQEGDIESWIAENIPEDYRELSERPQEWWDSLTENQRLAAEIFAEPVRQDDSYYNDQTLDKIIDLLENQEINCKHFFTNTLFESVTIEQLHELQDMGLELDDLADAILGLYGYEEYFITENDQLLKLAATLYENLSVMTAAFLAQYGDAVAYMKTKDTGYEDGYGHKFWRISNGGQNVYCFDHGKTLRSAYAYGNFTQSTGAAEYLVSNYGGSTSMSDEGYMTIQMAVWAFQAGQTASQVYTYAFSWFVKGGMESSQAASWAATTKTMFNLADGKSGSCYIAEGPAGSQRPAKPTPFVTTTYSGGSAGGGEEAVEPEFDTVEDSITVSYEVKVKKTDWQTGIGLAGCKVKIYEDGSKVDTVTTGSDGKASYQTSKTASFTVEYCTNYDDLTSDQQAEIDCCTSLAEARRELESQKSAFADQSYTYSCKEVTAPTGYVWQANEKSAAIKGNGSATLKITNERTLGAVELIKYDTESESDMIQGEATLEGAIYGIYAAENIVHQDKKTGVIYQKDQLIATGIIGKSPKRNADGYILNTDGSRHIANPGGTIAYVDTPGKTLFGDLELGKYYIKEITPAEGYLLDETAYQVTFTYKDQMVKIETRNETAADADNTLTADDDSTSKIVYSGDYVIKQGIQFIKTSDNTYQTELKPIAGAGFKIYLIEDLSGVKDGTLTPVNETWGSDDIMTFYDYDFSEESSAVLYKRTNESWTAGDAKWLSSLGGNKYEVTEMITDTDGRIETPELPFGTYVVVETTTPEHHVCAKPFIVYITQDGGVLYTDATKQTVEKTYTEEEAVRYGDRKDTKEREGRVLQKQRIINNTITKTYVRIVKADEEFLLQTGDYIKPEEVVRGTVLKEGAEYRLRCATFDLSEESLIALNWKYDADGYLSYYDAYTKSMVGTKEKPFTTSFLKSNGKVLDCYITLPQELPVGSYELIETKAPNGYVINGSEQTVCDTSAGRVNSYEIIDTPKTTTVFTIGNGSVYPDGQMGTNKYALQDSYGNLTVTVLQKNQEQKGIVEITKHGEQLAKIDQDQEFIYEDAPVEGAGFQIIAMEDIYTQELDKSLLEQYQIDQDAYLLHKKGDVAATITTDRHGFGYASGLYIGKYKLVETVAGNGFVLNTTETEFEITAQEQTVNFDIYAADYKNERQKLEISVKKTDAETGEALSGAVYGLYAAEDIYTSINYDDTLSRWIIRDVPELILAKGSLVATCTTDESGKAFFAKDLPLGKYDVRELQAPEGYFKALEDVLISANYQDAEDGQNTEIQKYTAEFMNYATKAVVLKKDVTNGEPLAGVELEVIDESGKQIAAWITEGSGKNIHYFYENEDGFLKELSDPSMLPEGKLLIEKEGYLLTGLLLEKEYILRETKTASGYVTAPDIRFKLIQEKDEEGKLKGIAGLYYQNGDEWLRATDDILIMFDDITKLQISKKDITNGAELPGATLEIYDATDTLITSWVSTEQVHYIEKLPIGKYRLVEKAAPSGYGYAADIEFDVRDTGEIQKVEMFDDVQKLDIEKSTISLTQRGDTYKYSIDVIKNCTDDSMDYFTMTDVLPNGVRLTELWTGTYNQAVNYLVEYKTNQNTEWTIWKEQLDTGQIYHLELPANLGEEYITEFRFCFGTVNGGFENMVSPVYMVQVKEDAADILKNIVQLTGEQNATPYMDKSMTETKIYLKSIAGYAPEGGGKPIYDITGNWNSDGMHSIGLSGKANSGKKNKYSVYGNSDRSVTGDPSMLNIWLAFSIIAAAFIEEIHVKRKRN